MIAPTVRELTSEEILEDDPKLELDRAQKVLSETLNTIGVVDNERNRGVVEAFVRSALSEDEIRESLRGMPIQGVTAPSKFPGGPVPVDEGFERFINSSEDVKILPKPMQKALHGFEKLSQSPVGQALNKLGIPMQMATGLAVRVLDPVTGDMPGQDKGLKESLNFTGEVIPDLFPSDVFSSMTVRPKDVFDYLQENGAGPTTTALLTTTYKMSRGISGFFINFFADPLMYTRFARLTNTGRKAALTPQFTRSGQVADQTRNFIDLVNPISGETLKLPQIVPGIGGKAAAVSGEQVKRVIHALPGGKKFEGLVRKQAAVTKEKAGALLSWMSPFTGVAEIDTAMAAQNALHNGVEIDHVSRFARPFKKLKFSEQEMDLITDLGEISTNINPFPKGEKFSGSKKFLTEEKVHRQIDDNIQRLAKKRGLKLSEDRMLEISNATKMVKEVNKEYLQIRVKNGLLNVDSVAESTIKNYMAHTISPEAKAWLRTKKVESFFDTAEGKQIVSRNPEFAAAIVEAEQANFVQKSFRTESLRVFDDGKHRRSIRTTLQKANDILQEKTGIASWFVRDPMAASLSRLSSVKHFVNDSHLVKTLAKFGEAPAKGKNFRIAREEFEKKGWKRIPHPQLSNVDVVSKAGNKAKFGDLFFPSEVSTKISYYIVPKNVTTGGQAFVSSINSYADTYNRVFRGFALASPDFWAQNFAENVVKNFAQFVTIEDYIDSMKIITRQIKANKATVRRATASGIRQAQQKGKAIKAGRIQASKTDDFIMVNGEPVHVDVIRQMSNEYSVSFGGSYQEGLGKNVDLGKNIANSQRNIADRALGFVTTSKLSPAKYAVDMVAGMNYMGERAENFTRMALFMNRLKKGASPAVAAFEVEKFLFNFQRNTKGVDLIRRWVSPFIQAAIKTGQVAPELLVSAPGRINFTQNVMMETLGKAMRDPMTQDALQRFVKDWIQLKDAVAGPLFGDETMMAQILSTPEQLTGGGIVPIFTLPIGFDILNQFAVWDPRILRRGGPVSSPLLKAMTSLVNGVDFQSGQRIDYSRLRPDASRRIEFGFSQIIDQAFAVSNLKRSIFNSFGIDTDPLYTNTLALNLIHGSFGKFVRFLPLHREYILRNFSLQTAEMELKAGMAKAYRQEVLRKTIGSSPSKGS